MNVGDKNITYTNVIRKEFILYLLKFKIKKKILYYYILYIQKKNCKKLKHKPGPNQVKKRKCKPGPNQVIKRKCKPGPNQVIKNYSHGSFLLEFGQAFA
jgi:hypothetical protein